MNCKNCKSERIAGIGAKCSDRFNASIGDKSHDGYVLDDMGVGGGDYIDIDFCMDCGQIQGKFPLPECELEMEPECEWCGERKADVVERKRKHIPHKCGKACDTCAKAEDLETYEEEMW